MTLSRKFKSISYVHGPNLAVAYMMLFGMVIEACAAAYFGLDGIGGLFAIAAIVFGLYVALVVYSIVRFERKYR